MKKILIVLLIFSLQSFGQENTTVNYTQKKMEYDISNLFELKEFNYGLSNELVKRAQPIGYIGNNYQRFHIHFTSVIKNPNNSTEYFVYGKTKVKNNICEFQGKITINNVEKVTEPEFPNIETGIINGKYEFYETPGQTGTGILEGTFQTNFFVDKNGEQKYNALMFSADGFYNNMFQGTWTSYKTRISKECNWGDYRIPDSGDLHLGAGEFAPNPDFNEFGWRNYTNAYFKNNDETETKKAIQIENESWWIEK